MSGKRYVGGQRLAEPVTLDRESPSPSDLELFLYLTFEDGLDDWWPTTEE